MVQSSANKEYPLRSCPFKSSEDHRSVRRKRVMVIPAANIDESDHEYILTLACPGFQKKNFQVLIDKNIITIAAAKEEAGEKFIQDRCEYDFHRWKRDFLLPDDADALMTRARYRDGELIIRIPKGKTDKLKEAITIYVY